jgi:hypothetical protein
MGHRYVHVGVTEDFPALPHQLEVAMRGIVSALFAIRPDQSGVIQRADEIQRIDGDQMQFLLRRREASKLVIELSSKIAAWPKLSYLFIAHTNKATNVYSVAEPLALGFYYEGFDLHHGKRIQDAIDLTERPPRPAISGLIRRRG